MSPQTLQTTTVAAQASVSRRDMSVVTAVRNVSPVLQTEYDTEPDETILVHPTPRRNVLPCRRSNHHVGRSSTSRSSVPYETASYSNNSLRHTMTALSLPSATIAKIVDDPTILGARTSASASSLTDLGLSSAIADRILDAYIRGFRTVFVLNASLNAVATVAAIVLIKHKDLNRGDEEELKKKAAEEEAQRSEKSSIVVADSSPGRHHEPELDEKEPSAGNAV